MSPEPICIGISPEQDLPFHRSVLTPDQWLQRLSQPDVEFAIPAARQIAHRQAWKSPCLRLIRHLVILLEAGELNAGGEGWEATMKPGDVLVLPPGVVRQFSGVFEQSLRLHLGLTQDDTQFVWTETPLHKTDCWDLQPLFSLLHENTRSPRALGNAEYIRGIGQAIVVGIMNAATADTKRGRVLDARQRDAIRSFLLDHLDDGPSPEDLARVVGLSADYFSRVFRQTYGSAPRIYLKEERIRRAADLLLETEMSNRDICEQLKINDASLFCAQFRKLYGCTPQEYRGFRKDR